MCLQVAKKNKTINFVAELGLCPICCGYEQFFITNKNVKIMIYSHEVEHMCVVKKGPNHGPAPIPEEGKWVKSKEIKDISGLTHGIGWCAPQQGACKLTLNVKEGIIQEALVETIGCSGMTHSAAMASEIQIGRASCRERV